jgi:hypothetical protein
MTSNSSTSASVRVWQAIATVAVVPGIVHLMVLSAGAAGMVNPAIWISGHLLAGPWSVPLLWILVIGGPLVSVIAGLTLELWRGTTGSVGRACGMFAWAMLIVGLVTTVPFPWILAFD